MENVILLSDGTFSSPVEFGNGRFVCKLNDTLRINLKITFTHGSGRMMVLKPNTKVKLTNIKDNGSIILVEYKNKFFEIRNSRLDYEYEEKINKN
jgi:hypothetical protein